MPLSEAIEAVGKMLRGYPHDRKADGGYIGAIAAMLCSYPRQVAMKCADPIRGLARSCKFLPTPADVVAWCEKAVQPLYNDADREQRVAKQLAERERVIDQNPEMRERIVRGFAELSEQLKRAQMPSAAEQSAKAERDKAKIGQRLAQVTAEWGGREAPTIGGIPVSRELANMLRPQAEAAE